MNKNPPIFYVTESRFCCSQPVRVGDLLRVKSLGSGWRLEGKIFLVAGGDDKHEVATGIVDGKLESLWVANLEAISEF